MAQFPPFTFAQQGNVLQSPPAGVTTPAAQLDENFNACAPVIGGTYYPPGSTAAQQLAAVAVANGAAQSDLANVEDAVVGAAAISGGAAADDLSNVAGATVGDLAVANGAAQTSFGNINPSVAVSGSIAGFASGVWAAWGGVNIANSDNGVPLNALITALSTNGGGTITLAEQGNYTFTTGIIRKRNVSLICLPGAWLKWGGAAGTSTSPPLIQSDITDVLVGSESRINIDSNGYGGLIVQDHSAYRTQLRVWHKDSSFSSTSTVLTTSADSTGGGDTFNLQCNACNVYELISVATCGIALVTFGLSGSGVTYMGQPQVVTLNQYIGFQSFDAWVKGIDIRSWTDSIHFLGSTRVGASSSNNAIGLDVGSVDGTAVYNIEFAHFAPDTFDATKTGVIGIRLGSGVRGIAVRKALIGPPYPSGGQFVANAGALTYLVSIEDGSTGQVVTHTKGWQVEPVVNIGSVIGVVAFNAGNSPTPTTITGWTAAYGANLGFNFTTGLFVAPISGLYEFAFTLTHDATIQTGDRYVFDIQQSGSGTASRQMSYKPPAAAINTVSGMFVLPLVAGDTVAGLQITTVAGAGQFQTISNDAANAFTITLLQAA